MTLQLLLFCLCSLCLWSVNCQVGAGTDTTIVLGDTPFVMDGTRELTLTCNTTVSLAFFYTLALPGPRPCPSPGYNTCTFRPRLLDDGMNAICTVLNSSNMVLDVASYEIDLLYPPPAAPNITMESSWTKPLKQGDNITCTVSGGKPRVTNITFQCQNPYHKGRQTDIEPVRTITVNTSLATADNMTCNCSADWVPEPALYPDTTFKEFVLEYSPRLADDSFDLAKRHNLTQAGMTLTVVGVPTPNITVSFCGNNTVNKCQPAADSAFNKNCKRNLFAEHLVDCTITPVNIAKDKTGLYNMTIANALGNVTAQFQILQAVTPLVPTLPPADNGLSAVTIVIIAVPTTGGVGLVVIVIVIVVKKKKKANTRNSCQNTPQQNYVVSRSDSGQTSQRVTATVQPQVHSQAHHNQMSSVSMAEPGYACPADVLPSGSIHAAEASTTKPNPYDPGYASADQIGISTDPQRVAYNPSTNSLKSRSTNQYSDIPLQPAEPANKPQDDGVDDYNVLGGQGATSGPDPTYSHINKVNKNQ